MADNETTKVFNDTLDSLKKMDPTEVQSFIVLVEGQDTDDGKHAKGLQAVCGNLNKLMNLLGNIREDILNPFVVAYIKMELDSKAGDDD